jgi:short-subunit dehydrogenase
MRLAGARVLVTGASRGIGAELATECARRGARVALVARSPEPLAKLAADLGGDAYPADLGDADAIDGLVARIEADGPVDVLVNNAGVDLTGGFAELPADAIRQLVAINLVAPMLMSRACIPFMRARGRGHILNVGSISATNALPGLVPYASSKAGLSHFTAGLRAELKGSGITTTLAELSTIEGSMVDSLRAHEPTRRAMRRLERLHLLVDMKMDTVIVALADAIENERRHVRMPARDALFPMIQEVPRRLTEWMLTGVKP